VALLADFVEFFVGLVVGVKGDGDESSAVALLVWGAWRFGEVFLAAVAAGPVDAPCAWVEVVCWSAVAGGPWADAVVGFPGVRVAVVEFGDVGESGVLGFGVAVAFVSAFCFDDPFGLF